MSYFMNLLLTVLILTGCSMPKVKNIPPLNSAQARLEFISIDPRSSVWFEKETAEGTKRFFWENLSNEVANANLPLERSFVSIIKIETEGSIGFASAKFSGSIGKYRIILDYAKYRDEVMIEKGDKIPCRVGVGVRIVANISTKKANIDLSGLFPIAFAAKSGFLNGQIEVLKIGIDSAGLNMILPPPSEINDTSLQSALQAVAAIRAKLYDQNTKLIPHVLAIQYRQQVTK